MIFVVGGTSTSTSIVLYFGSRWSTEIRKLLNESDQPLCCLRLDSMFDATKMWEFSHRDILRFL
jgi:hypothetical protein